MLPLSLSIDPIRCYLLSFSFLFVSIPFLFRIPSLSSPLSNIFLVNRCCFPSLTFYSSCASFFLFFFCSFSHLSLSVTFFISFFLPFCLSFFLSYTITKSLSTLTIHFSLFRHRCDDLVAFFLQSIHFPFHCCVISFPHLLRDIISLLTHLNAAPPQHHHVVSSLSVRPVSAWASRCCASACACRTVVQCGGEPLVGAAVY